MKAANVVVLGESGVGKTAIIQRLVTNVFDTQYHSTLGVRVWRKDYTPCEITFYFHDVQGVHMPDALLKTYTGAADAYILVCDAPRRRTASSTEFYWAERIEPKKPVILVENKVDMVKNLVVHAKALFRLEQKMRAKGINVCYSTVTSAKTGFHLSKILQKAGEACLRTLSSQ
ncbi:MAG: GTP-binding protein [Thermoplasmata archaeon]|nr:GTP-binding protein [Thermoplasmata archaeon]